MNRRRFFSVTTGLPACLTAVASGSATSAEKSNPVGVSSYSFWRFRNDQFRPIEVCLDASAKMGFEGLEILQRQLVDTSPDALNKIKSHAFALGLDVLTMY